MILSLYSIHVHVRILVALLPPMSRAKMRVTHLCWDVSHSEAPVVKSYTTKRVRTFHLSSSFKIPLELGQTALFFSGRRSHANPDLRIQALKSWRDINYQCAKHISSNRGNMKDSDLELLRRTRWFHITAWKNKNAMVAWNTQFELAHSGFLWCIGYQPPKLGCDSLSDIAAPH